MEWGLQKYTPTYWTFNLQLNWYDRVIEESFIFCLMLLDQLDISMEVHENWYLIYTIRSQLQMDFKSKCEL